MPTRQPPVRCQQLRPWRDWIRGSPRSSRWSTSAAIQIREAARELQSYLESQDFDAARQDQVQRRLAAIEELARKNRVAPAAAA